MAAKVAGAGTIVAIDRHANRLELAERYGATATISTSPDRLAAAIHAATGGGSDYTFDTTGNAGVVRGLYEGLNNIGTLGMAGVGFGEVTLDFLSMISGRTITGVIEGDFDSSRIRSPARSARRRRQLPLRRTDRQVPTRRHRRGRSRRRNGAVVEPVLIF